MHKIVLGNAALVLALVGFTGCPNGGNDPDAGPPPDMCNSIEEALSDERCNLRLGGEVIQYVGFAGDTDWFRVELSAGMTVRDLIRIRGGYGPEVPQTPVNFAMSVLHENADGGTTGMGRVIDRHGPAAPKRVELVFRAPQPTTNPLLIQAGDEMLNPSLPKFEPRYAYKLFAESLTDPDTNEPNDATPASITLAGSSGTAQGYLSVPNDVDLYSVVVPSSASPRKILYVHVTAPDPVNPPAPFRLQFTLYDPAGDPVSENIAPAGAQFFAVDLATARLAAGGTWLIKVQGYKASGSLEPVPGDVTYPYTVNVAILDEQDANEPDDTIATAVTRSLPMAGSSTQVTGRLEWVGDLDWYRVNVASTPQPTVLHYKLTPNGPGGRFPPLSSDPDRVLNVVSEVDVTGYPDLPAARAACQTDPAVCPQGWIDDSAFTLTVMGLCDQYDPPRCLQSRREEDIGAHPDMRNFEGAISIPASQAMTYVFSYQDLRLSADDKDYTLYVERLADPDEAGRNFSGGIEQPIVVPLAEDPNPAANGFPVPFAGATVLTGTLSHGHGMVFDPELILDGNVIRGAWDYDAVTSDVDKWELTIPAQDPGQPMDRTWELQWEVRKAVGGAVVHDLDVEVVFCDGDTGSPCTPVAPSSHHGFALTYSDEAIHSWHNTSDAYQVVWDRTQDGGVTTTTANAYGCFCFEPRFVRGGKFDINVLALNRQSYQPVTYTLRTAFTAYPQQYRKVGADAGFKSCPAPVSFDAGVLPDGGVADAGTPPRFLGCEFVSSTL